MSIPNTEGKITAIYKTDDATDSDGSELRVLDSTVETETLPSHYSSFTFNATGPTGPQGSNGTSGWGGIFSVTMPSTAPTTVLCTITTQSGPSALSISYDSAGGTGTVTISGSLPTILMPTIVPWGYNVHSGPNDPGSIVPGTSFSIVNVENFLINTDLPDTPFYSAYYVPNI